jgi:hypothetical protein
MKKLAALLTLIFCATVLTAQSPERKVFTVTPTYDQVIETYTGLYEKYGSMALLTMVNQTDIGKPLYCFIISKDRTFKPEDAKTKGKTVIMINNGIHPGEPDGIDACIELSKTLLEKPALLPGNVVICIIPVYNDAGCINRGTCSRANQCGPEEYGFRGNALNLDLNRDMIKGDSKNTQSLWLLIRQWNPGVFIDTHVSDGADYQHVMTLIATQRNKLHPLLSEYMDKQMLPALYGSMKTKKLDMCPYVETMGRTPESGIVGFLETPRFTTGYTSLFNCLGFVTETHMWKPYNERVWATYELLLSFIAQVSKDAATIEKLRRDADLAVSMQKTFPLAWELDTTSYELIDFKGYEAKTKKSGITGLDRLYYDRNAPFTKKVKFYNTYRPVNVVEAPAFYIIPQAYAEVIALMKMTGVTMKRLKKDTVMNVEVYYIASYQTVRTPYESHYMHYGTKVKRDTQLVRYLKGDYIVPVNQPANRYIVETLEPEGGDSFFAWNFFDGILAQKEWFSDYIFEEKADSVLKSDPVLNAQFREKQRSDTAFAADHWGQLNYIYQNSGFKEKTHNRYPVARLNYEAVLPVE